MHIQLFLIIVFFVCCLAYFLYLKHKRRWKPNNQRGGTLIKCDQDFEVIDNTLNKVDGTGIIIRSDAPLVVLRDNVLVNDKKAAN